MHLKQWLLLLLTGSDKSSHAQTTISKDYDLDTLSGRSKIGGIWKLKLEANQKVEFKAYTYRQKNFIDADCQEFNVKILVQNGAPSLPSSYFKNEIKSMFNSTAVPILDETLVLSQIKSSSNSTNEVFTEFTTTANSDSFITAWYEPGTAFGDLSLQRKLQEKFDLTTCQPRLQFNVTRLASDNNDPSENEIETIQLPISKTLSKKVTKEHDVFFFDMINGTMPNATVESVCDVDRLDRYFAIDSDIDTGGVIEIKLNGRVTQAQLCLSQSVDNSTCGDHGQHTLLNNQSFYMPHPMSGNWKLDLFSIECDNASEMNHSTLNLTLTDCVNACGKEKKQGACNTYYTAGNFIMSSCICKAGYVGISCSNDENAMSNSLQLVQVMLLTLSNLFFLPAIFIALYRRFWQETVIYIIAMSVSSIYHACDQGHTQKYYCIADYDTLQYADFLAATIAIWATVLVIADLPTKLSSILYNTGIICFAIGTHYNRFSLWLYAAPVTVGLLILVSHWIYQCRLRRDCYPTSRTWICHLIPGTFLALSGFVIKIFFEFDEEGHSNFYWTHTLWHAFLGLACAFLLPDIAYEANKPYTSTNDNLISYYKSFGDPTFEPNAI